ncbi:MAG: cytochrome c biogenesis protein DipZ, partial [Proteobacteria bacterium]|nr:cytochrome c biogenesis protein DipZ [Pseudomonadota bacterium]
KKVFLVLGTASGTPIQISIHLNGRPVQSLMINHDTLYELINQKASRRGLLEITTDAPGLEAYAFTFG